MFDPMDFSNYSAPRRSATPEQLAAADAAFEARQKAWYDQEDLDNARKDAALLKAGGRLPGTWDAAPVGPLPPSSESFTNPGMGFYNAREDAYSGMGTNPYQPPEQGYWQRAQQESARQESQLQKLRRLSAESAKSDQTSGTWNPTYQDLMTGNTLPYSPPLGTYTNEQWQMPGPGLEADPHTWLDVVGLTGLAKAFLPGVARRALASKAPSAMAQMPYRPRSGFMDPDFIPRATRSGGSVLEDIVPTASRAGQELVPYGVNPLQRGIPSWPTGTVNPESLSWLQRGFSDPRSQQFWNTLGKYFTPTGQAPGPKLPQELLDSISRFYARP